MSLSPEEVMKISHLARLDIDGPAMNKYSQELSSIMNLAEQMQQVNTDAIAPTTHPLDIHQRLRPDVVTETDQRIQLQKCAPLAKDASTVEAGLYLVPQVIE